MGINLLSYPYVDSTITRGDITFTDLGNGSLSAQGTKSGAAYIRLESYDTLSLEAGTYTMRGTGYSYLAYTVELKPTEGTSTYLDVDASNKTFTVSESVTVRVDLDVSAVRGTEIPRTVVYPQLEAGTELSPWTPYRPPTTIDAENAKQIRQTMDVVIQVTPEQGEPIVINNSNLISCTVSLRSDLSIIEPTLPESEINIEAYFDDDISDVLASIPDETPVTYQAGYPGDMSPVRNFYLAEQITWRDNVMSIHAVDAVHKLDTEMPYALTADSLWDVYWTIAGLIALGGIAVRYYTFISRYVPDIADDSSGVIIKRGTLREQIAKLMWLFSAEIESTASESYISAFRPAFTDAGIPTLRYAEQTPKWDIYENDCGNVLRNTERSISSVSLSAYSCQFGRRTDFVPVGSYDWYKDSGVFLNLEEMTQTFEIEVPDEYMAVGTSSGYAAVVPNLDNGETYITNPPTFYYTIKSNTGVESNRSAGNILFDGDVKKGGPKARGRDGTPFYTQFVPWNCPYDSDDFGFLNITSQATAWAKVVSNGGIPSNATSASFDLIGSKVNAEVSEKQYTGASGGRSVAVTEDSILGDLTLEDSQGLRQNIFPDGSMNNLIEAQNVTGQFTWKGDPRMQPRDVVTFHRLDGTAEDITIENITITHEKGGTSAEITYRKGIC